ncbi:hypothetical protein CW734_00910 (plasmid) [Planococcus sp. MB-3u-03]|nr:hypothetical protein CW734_00910 [Planococcus sp. MB-3u-03]
MKIYLVFSAIGKPRGRGKSSASFKHQPVAVARFTGLFGDGIQAKLLTLNELEEKSASSLFTIIISVSTVQQKEPILCGMLMDFAEYA